MQANIDLINAMTESFLTLNELSRILNKPEKWILSEIEKIKYIKCIDMLKTSAGKYCIRNGLRR